jgi:hypothetical protein
MGEVRVVRGGKYPVIWICFKCIPLPVAGPRKGPLSRALRLVAYNTTTHLNPPLEYYELKDN